MSIQKNKLQVRDCMLPLNQFPIIGNTAIFKEALEEMVTKRLGISCIVSPQMKLIGIITDGDIRRKLLKSQKPLPALLIDDAINLSIQNPVVISPEDTLQYSVDVMERKQIWDLPVVSKDALVGLLHLHPAIKTLFETCK